MNSQASKPSTIHRALVIPEAAADYFSLPNFLWTDCKRYLHLCIEAHKIQILRNDRARLTGSLSSTWRHNGFIPCHSQLLFYPNYSKCWLPKVQYSQHATHRAASMRRWLGNCIICSRWWMNNRHAYIRGLALSGQGDTDSPYQIHSVCGVRRHTENARVHSLSL